MSLPRKFLLTGAALGILVVVFARLVPRRTEPLSLGFQALTNSRVNLRRWFFSTDGWSLDFQVLTNSWTNVQKATFFITNHLDRQVDFFGVGAEVLDARLGWISRAEGGGGGSLLPHERTNILVDIPGEAGKQLWRGKVMAAEHRSRPHLFLDDQLNRLRSLLRIDEREPENWLIYSASVQPVHALTNVSIGPGLR